MAGEADLYEALDDRIAAAIKTLPLSDGDADDPATWSDEERKMLATLRADKSTLDAHREPARLGLTDARDPVRCAACNEPRTCPTMLDMGKRYDLSTNDYRGDR